jgi:hypothetical protein
MKRGKLGCLLWVTLAVFVVLWGWKLVDFYVIQPATVKKGMNETSDQVSRMQNTAAKQVEYLSVWAEWERTSDIPFTSTAFQGDSFVVEWVDTLHVPVFPSIVHSFRLKKLVQ